MSSVKLQNGTVFEILGVHGRSSLFQGVSRDCLTFLFDPARVSLPDLLDAFQPQNCAQIIVADDDGEYLHEHYTIRLEAGTGLQEQILGLGSAGETSTSCHFVKMCQSTLAERELLAQREQIDALLVAALEG